MNTSDALQTRTGELHDAARAVHAAAERPGSYVAVPHVLESLEKTLQALGGACYQLAADGPDGPSREQEVRLMATLHDVAAAFGRCARACREGRSAATPIVARRLAAADRERSSALRPFERHDRQRERAA